MDKRMIRLAGPMLGAILAAAWSSSWAAGWFKPGGDARNTRSARPESALISGSVLWTHAAEGALAVAEDGTLYVSHVKLGDHKLEALTPGGSVKWTFLYHGPRNESPCFSSLAIDKDGTIYVGALDKSVNPKRSAPCSLYAITPAGTLKWKFPAPVHANIYPLIGPDGTLYVTLTGTMYDNNVHALTTGGKEKWKYHCNGDFEAPALGADGTVYAGCSGALLALTPAGKLKWSFGSPTGIGILDTTVAADGTIYYIDRGLGTAGIPQQLLAITPLGKRKWKAALGAGEKGGGEIAVGDDGTVFVASRNSQERAKKQVFAFTPAGVLQWTYQAGDIAHCLSLGGDGTIFVGFDLHKIIALSPAGAERWRIQTDKDYQGIPTSLPVDSFALGPEGTLYVQAAGKTLALGSGAGPASSVEPTARRVAAIESAPGTAPGSISGQWQSVCCGGKYTATIELKQESSRLTGTFVDSSNASRGELRGSIEGGRVRFTRDLPGGPQTYELRLEPSGDAMTGSLDGYRDYSASTEVRLTREPAQARSAAEGACGLGVRWEEQESGWNGIWKRRGTSDVFDADWTKVGNRWKAVLTVKLDGRRVLIQRKDITLLNGAALELEYEGTLGADGRTVTGTYGNSGGPKDIPWQATIHCDL